MKQCTKCLQNKEFLEFYSRKGVPDGRESHCKECKKTYRLNNSDSIKERNKKYYSLNKEDIRKKQTVYYKDYYPNNREKVLSKSKKYAKSNKEKRRRSKNKRYMNDPNSRIREILRCRLNVALKGIQKKGSAIRDLGCTIQQFKLYIESKFQEGMTWDNHGKTGWHLDHIKPLSSFDLSDKDQLKQATHYTNLQPLWAKDNLQKGCKYVLNK